MTNFQKHLQKEIRPQLQKQFGYKNLNAGPIIQKITLNVGIRSDLKDVKVIDEFVRDLKAITGQQPVKTLAKKSISAFKIRTGQVIGLMVTLRGDRMYDFLEKLLKVTLARIRDFRGLESSSFDRQGNYSIGFKDQIAFPEISSESVSHMFGMQITITISARNPKEAQAYLKLIGLPLKNSEKR